MNKQNARPGNRLTNRSRNSTGYIDLRISPRKPGRRTLDEAKALALTTFRSSGYVYCPCCRATYALASVAKDVSEQGYCGYCAPYVEGRDDSIVVRRKPTLRDVIKQVKTGRGLADIEARVLLEAYQKKGARAEAEPKTLAGLMRAAVIGKRIVPCGKRKPRTISDLTFHQPETERDAWAVRIDFTSGESGEVDLNYDEVVSRK